MPDQALVIVANRLPIEAATAEDGSISWQSAPGGLVAALEPALRSTGGSWIGWNGRYQDPYDPPIPPVPTTSEDGKFGMFEVPLTGDQVRRYYDGFSNSALWPLYHDGIATPVFSRQHFDAYHKVNQLFAEVVADRAEDAATVWVQDYQLQLVPDMLRRLRPDLTIGFFLHIPFPAPDLFMQLPWRRQIVTGLLGADVVGFHTTGGAANFRAVAEQLLGWSTSGTAISVPNPAEGSVRDVIVDSFPISVDVEMLERIARHPDTESRAAQIRQDLGNPSLVLLGVDRLDYTKGIDVRLRAYTELLRERRLDPADTVLVQVATPSRENVDEYQRIRDDVELIVGHTNGELGSIGAPAIHYVRNNLPLTELVALYRAADIMLVTPLRDGMNLVCKEYVVSRIDDSGALVLSEFTGAARELPWSWLVNPYDADGVKDAIVDAAQSSPAERRRRMTALRSYVGDHDVHRWAQSFLAALKLSRETNASGHL